MLFLIKEDYSVMLFLI